MIYFYTHLSEIHLERDNHATNQLTHHKNRYELMVLIVIEQANIVIHPFQLNKCRNKILDKNKKLVI
ncbi:MAG TPA: hypothetical protein VN704_11185 [Verrucomicrobiae bacterium]|nr:hypothetical protein [Verrucomicrobiae bacterium]